MLQKFKVTKHTLAEAVKQTNAGGIDVCAIAMAMKSKYPKVRVGVDGATLDKDKGEPFIPFPQKVTDYVVAFDQADDAGRLALPELEFELDIPEKAKRRAKKAIA